MKMTPQGLIVGVIAIVILFTVAVEVLPTLFAAGDDLNATGYPLAGLFASDSILPVIIMAVLLLGVIGYFMGKGKSR